MTGILQSTLWRFLVPYFRVEVYGRDGGPDKPRHRIEVDAMPRELRLQALALTVPCVACGRAIHPIRRRAARGRALGHLYYASTCPLDVSLPCSRGEAARQDYITVRRAIEAFRAAAFCGAL